MTATFAFFAAAVEVDEKGHQQRRDRRQHDAPQFVAVLHVPHGGRHFQIGLFDFPLGIAAFKIFFDMDFIDTIYCVVVVSLVNDWAMVFLIGLIFSGGGVGI